MNNNSGTARFMGMDRSFSISLFNILLAIGVSALLLFKLDKLKDTRMFANEEVTTVQMPVQGDSTQMIEKTVIKSLPTESKTGSKPLVNFLDVIILMLIAGALGGVLCNLRGVFYYYREDGALPDELHVPYLARPFTAAVCGLLVYFVASLLVTSITVQPIADGIGFQGMISYIALAIVAGYGAQEFMEKLKALSETLFGEKKPEPASRKLQAWHRMMKKGIISPDDYDNMKATVLSGGDTPGIEMEVNRNPPKPPVETKD